MNSLEKIIDNFEKSDGVCDFRIPVGDEKIVFIHDCYQKKYGKVFEFKDEEYQTLTSLLGKTKIPSSSYQFVAAVKTFNVTEDDITTKELKEHRDALAEDLEAIMPDLIIPLGNLAMKTLLKKSGITSKRGKEFAVDIDGKVIPVVPTLHPFSLYAEPKLRGLFLQDVDNAYTKFILRENKLDGSPYELVNGDINRFNELMDLVERSEAVSFDLETGGLDFKKHKLMTLGLAYGEKQAFVVPIFHKECEFTPIEVDHIKSRVVSLMKNPNIVKIAHNAKFDLKFLMNWGVSEFNNIEDTQVLHSLVDENLPHALMDLVKQYFPKELETF